MLQGVQWLDRRFANPAYILLPVTGIIMVIINDLGFTTLWIATAIGLYVAVAVFAGVAFSPVLRRQVEIAGGGGTEAEYAAVARRTTTTGAIILAMVVAIEFLMVTKPG